MSTSEQEYELQEPEEYETPDEAQERIDAWYRGEAA